MKEQGSSRSKRVWVQCIVSIFAAGLVAAMLGLGSLRGTHRANLQTTTNPSATNFFKGASLLEGPGLPWYIRSGQWRADMRSLVAAFQYLAQTDTLQHTNLMPAKADKV